MGRSKSCGRGMAAEDSHMSYCYGEQPEASFTQHDHQCFLAGSGAVTALHGLGTCSSLRLPATISNACSTCVQQFSAQQQLERLYSM